MHSATLTASPRLYRVTRPGPRLAAGITGLLVTLACWHARARQRRQLLALDARQLRDVGISRSDALREGSKPFWKA